jgi:hypothetical protein
MKGCRIFLLLLLMVGGLFAQGTSEWVHFGPSHKLQYRTDAQGNRIMDFSSAGYKAGGVRLPTVAVTKKLNPIPGDNTAQVQAAIDAVSGLAVGADGFRGAVLLQAGEYELAGTVHITTSGVVLRGTGSGDGGTMIKLTGTPHRFLEIRGSGTWQPDKNSTPITDLYVASGADSFHVQEPSRFHTGDLVLVQRPVTEPWIHFMGMDTLVRDGNAQTWIRAGSSIRTDRVIKAIGGNRITLDVPLSDSFDSKFLTPPGPTLVQYSFPGRISQVGVESLRMVAPAQDVPISGQQYTVLLMDAVIDGWARDIDVRETQNGVVIGASAKRITLDSVRIIHAMPHSGAAAPADFSLSGTQIFLNRCSVMGEGTWPVVTQAMVTGPIVVLNFTADHAGVSPHQRWATGLLVDSARLENTTARKQGIAFSNRNTAGSGHGWDIGWAVAWNVSSPYLLVQQPPGAMNWCIGCVGKAVTSANIPSGIFDSPGTAVVPASLYLEQLRARLGEGALENIGYGSAKKRIK